MHNPKFKIVSGLLPRWMPSLTLGMTFGLAITFCTPFLTSVAAAGDHDHNAPVVSSKSEFKGDPYLLDTDPVTGEKLPEKPVIYQHDGREDRFANAKNVDAFKAEPAKYLPKLDEAMIKQQLPFYPLETCIVSDEKFGGDMGKPVDLIYKNRLVRFCCGGCAKEFKADPAKVIAKLDQAVIAKQGPGYSMPTCPVSGEKLGEMGKPIQIVAGNRLIEFCCSGCASDFKKNPTKYLKMLDNASKPAAK